MLWAEVNKINMSEFVSLTSPSFYVHECEMNDMDCKGAWEFRLTHLGRCLELNPMRVFQQWKSDSPEASFESAVISITITRHQSVVTVLISIVAKRYWNHYFAEAGWPRGGSWISSFRTSSKNDIIKIDYWVQRVWRNIWMERCSRFIDNLLY